MNGVITAWDLVTMSVKDLASDAVKKQREKTTEINMAARRTDWMIENAKATIGFFTCKKCKSKNTTYFQMQTRGADEPMTNFITCKDCLT
jgi:DNA-directed RNA polymerase subunit M/transcription elongation factor TFIIS